MSCWHLHISSVLVLFFLITWLIFNTAARIIPSFTNQNRSALLSKLHNDSSLMVSPQWPTRASELIALTLPLIHSCPTILASWLILKHVKHASALSLLNLMPAPLLPLGTELFFPSESFPKHEVKDCNPHPFTSFYFPSFISLLSI